MGRTANSTTKTVNDPNGRRDFLLVATGVVGGVGASLAAWPFVDFMNPSAEVRALASTDLDLTPIETGQRITLNWRGKPVFVSRRNAEEIRLAEETDPGILPDPAADADRTQRREWLVVLGVCTHLGCIPLGQRPNDPRGDFSGWFCPCHGSVFDTSCRIRRGPAPKNLIVPRYAFLTDDQLRIG